MRKKIILVLVVLIAMFSLVDFTPKSIEVEPLDVIGSYNILNDVYDKYDWYESYDVRVEQIAENIILSGSDIIGLYEVDDIELLMSYLPKYYDYIYQPREEIGVAIVYNTNAVTLKRSNCRSFTYHDEGSAGYCYASFKDNITNEDVLFIATHIAYVEPTSNTIQMKQAQELVAFINRYMPYFDQFYLVGDFNIDESYSMEYDIIEYLNTYNISCSSSNISSFPVSDLSLDYICGDINEVQTINDTYSSDHNIIYAKIKE